MNQKGLTPPIVLFVAAIGLIAFFVIASITPFRDTLYNRLFPKPPSEAAETFSRFAIAGCSGGPNNSVYCYDWNIFQNSVEDIVKRFSQLYNLHQTINLPGW